MDEVDCGSTDINCNIVYGAAKIVDGFARAESAGAWSFIKESFTGSAGTITSDEWTVATDMTSRWSIVVLVVVAGVTLVKVMTEIIGGSPQKAASGFIMGCLAWPFTVLSVYTAIRLTGGVDLLTIGILGSGDKSAAEVIPQIIGSSTVNYDMANEILGAANSPIDDEAVRALVQSLIVCMCALLQLLAAFLLAFMLAFRNFAMLVLIGFAPVAFMALPVRTTGAWARKWAEVTIALIIAKPVAAGVLVMSIDLFTSGSDFWQYLVGCVAMCMAAFAPVITMRMFSFIGGDQAAAQGSHGASVVTNIGAGAARGGKAVIGR